MVALCLVGGIILWRGMKEEEIEKKDEGKQYVRQVDAEVRCDKGVLFYLEKFNAASYYVTITNDLRSQR